MRIHGRLALVAALTAALLATSGCMIRREPLAGAGRNGSSYDRVALGEATSANVYVRMGAGRLSVDSAILAGDVFRGAYEFSPASLKPGVGSTVRDDTIDVAILQPEVRGLNFGTSVRSSWQIDLAEGVPMSLRVDLGAGEGDLDLSDLDISDLAVRMGAGDTTIDVTGPRTQDLPAAITAGVGELTIRLPEDVGVRVSGYSDGIGDWNYDGFSKDGDYLVNDAYGTTATTIELDVQRGVGTVTLELVD
jgi:hypothetical protein